MFVIFFSFFSFWIQTGSGKTHTMLGDIEAGTRRHSVNCGMTPRVFEYLFSRIQKARDFLILLWDMPTKMQFQGCSIEICFLYKHLSQKSILLIVICLICFNDFLVMECDVIFFLKIFFSLVDEPFVNVNRIKKLEEMKS